MLPTTPSAGNVVAGATYAAKAGRAVLRDPREGVLRVADVLADRRERRRRPFAYEADADWHRSLHSLCGLSWPCSVEGDFRRLWAALVEEMNARGLVLGRASFGGWDDGGPALALAAYCLARALRPDKIVETGVAHGVTTRFLLEALEHERAGRLWSIDLPPLVESRLEPEIAVLVPPERRERWTLCLGSSRRRLPGLLERLGSIGLFLHDSLHTERNVRFELAHAWGALQPGGALVVDDVDYNPGFAGFARATADGSSLVAAHDDGRRLFGVILKD
jgi:hypothetical protein